MIILRAAICALVFVGLSFNADARPRGGTNYTPPIVACTIGNDGGLCNNAPLGGLKQDTNFFTTARQSSQGQYYNSSGVQTNLPTDHDVGGVTYGIGPWYTDAQLIDATVSPPPGCAWNAGSVTLACTSPTTNFIGYKLIGGGITLSGAVTQFTAQNFHIQATSQSCNRFNGLALIQGGSAHLDITSGLFDYDSTCANNAQQYKTVGDPGLVDQSSGSATLIGNVLHYTATPTGFVNATQYIAGSGINSYTRITSGSYPDYIVELPTVHARLNGVQINGTHMTYTGYWNGTTLVAGVNSNLQVGDQVIGTGIANNTLLVADNGGGDWTVSISQTALSPGSVVGIAVPYNISSPVTVTTSPMESTFNAAVAAHGGNLGAKYRYNWSEGYPTFAGDTGAGDLDVQANMAIMTGRRLHPLNTSNVNDGQHDQFVAWLPAASQTRTGVKSIQDYNVILSQKWSADGIWTSFMSLFSTSSGTNPNYLINFSKVSFNHNFIIGNKALDNPTAAMTFSMWRVLSQGGGAQTGNVTWSMSAGVVTILSLNSGVVGVGDTIACISFPSCSKAVVLTSQIDATHFNTSNTVDTKTNQTNNVFHYPGQFTLLEAIGNGYDQTGNNGGTYSIEWPNIDIGTFTHTGSWNLLDGSAAN